MKYIFIPVYWLVLTLPLFGQIVQPLNPIVLEKGENEDFHLASNHSSAKILVDNKDSKTILLATKLFSEDIERITGHKLAIVNQIGSKASQYVIIGSVEKSEIIQRLVKKNKIDVSEIKGNWESCLIQTVNNPIPGVTQALVIAGSDRRGTAYGIFELSKQMGVSPWYYFADVSLKKQEEVFVKAGKYLQKSPSIKYRGIFINDEMWGLRPWAMNTLAPQEGKGIGPTTYEKIFELMLRLKANYLWPAMHQQTKPFNYNLKNSQIADEYGIVMGSSHIEPMLRNNIAGAEWDTEYPGEPWDYVQNKRHIYEYWEKRIIENGKYENVYTLGKRGKDDEAGTEITVELLGQILADQREILSKRTGKKLEHIPQILIPYTEVLELYNQGLEVPEDVIIVWPDDNFGNIRQLPNQEEQQRSGGSGVYYHFQWLNGATTAYPWLYTTPLALTWLELKKAYDFKTRELWIVNVGDIKPAEIGIEHFMQMAWNMDEFKENNPRKFLMDWASREFGDDYAPQIAAILEKHYELAYARRPENMVMYNAREKKLAWEWFSLNNYNDEVQQRIDEYDILINEVDALYKALPDRMKDSYYQMVSYNVKGAGLHNKKVLYAQKSHAYGQHNRASSARYAAMAQHAENEVHQLISHYNRELITVGKKWNYMASLPGPWGGQWQQWAMPPLNYNTGNGYPAMGFSLEGGDQNNLPGFSVFNRDKRFIDLFNTGNGVITWSSKVSEDWILLSDSSGVIGDEKRIWISIDWEKIPKGSKIDGQVNIEWTSARVDEWINYERLTELEKQKYRSGTWGNQPPKSFEINLTVFNPIKPSPEAVVGFVESNGYISMEAEHYSRKSATGSVSWNMINGLGRTGSSITVLPFNIPGNETQDDIMSKSPWLEYDIYTFTEGRVELEINCIPSFPINVDYGFRVAVALDDGKPTLVSATGKRNVMENLVKLTSDLIIDQEGQHVLKVWMVDPGVVMDKIIINTGGVRASYLGPPESLIHNLTPGNKKGD